MTLNTTSIDIQDISAAALSGYTTWPVAALEIEADIAQVYPEDVVAYFSPGRIGTPVSPPREGDAADAARIWAAQTAGTTLEISPSVLGGLPRYAFGGVAAGFYGDLSAPLTDYTVAILCRTPSVSGIKGLFNVGSTTGTRLYAYITANDVAIQHGTADVQTSPGAIVTADVWLPLIFSFRDSDNALRMYAGSTTPVISATMTNNPPSDVIAAIGSLRSGAGAFSGEIALVVVWNRPIHTDPAKLADLVAAMNALIAL